jgi:hypothetical protein
VCGRILSGRFSNGTDVRLAICDLQLVPYAIAMPMVRVRIYMAIRALIKPGQTVIMSPYTIADVVNMVICAGGIPVFADIQRQTANIDPAGVEPLIGERTGAVLVTTRGLLFAPLLQRLMICSAVAARPWRFDWVGIHQDMRSTKSEVTIPRVYRMGWRIGWLRSAMDRDQDV